MYLHHTIYKVAIVLCAQTFTATFSADELHFMCIGPLKALKFELSWNMSLDLHYCDSAEYKTSSTAYVVRSTVGGRAVQWCEYLNNWNWYNILPLSILRIHSIWKLSNQMGLKCLKIPTMQKMHRSICHADPESARPQIACLCDSKFGCVQVRFSITQYEVSENGGCPSIFMLCSSGYLNSPQGHSGTYESASKVRIFGCCC